MSRTGWIVAGGILLAVGTVVFSAATSVAQRRDQANLARCHKQMRAIGQACFLYANENDWQMPLSINDILRTQDCTSSIFVCPGSDDTRAAGRTSAETAANLTAGGHCSYVYCGRGMHGHVLPADAVLAYELPGHHRGGLSHVLYGDGHVDAVDAAMGRRIREELEAGHNPPRAERLK